MDFFDELKTAIKEYQKIFKRSDLPKLIPSGLYDLYPRKSHKNGISVNYSWPDEWPSGDNAGVYFVLNGSLDVLYIGKASMSNPLSNRLSRWFGYDKNRINCKPRDIWRGSPRYVVTIAVDGNLTFEAPALEEFLISRIKPKENTRGRQD